MWLGFRASFVMMLLCGSVIQYYKLPLKRIRPRRNEAAASSYFFSLVSF